jgi:D-lactate dehydrogenase
MARQPEGSAVLAKLQQQYEYEAIETCAGDGTCAIPCPIEINTGALMRSFRQAQHGPRAQAIALSIARRWGTVETLARVGLRAARIVSKVAGVSALRALTSVLRGSGLLSCLHQSDVRAGPRPAGNAVPARSPGDAVGACRPPALDSRRRERLVLFDAIQLEGLP